MSNYRLDLIKMQRMIELYSVTVPDAEVTGDGCKESRKFLVEYFEAHPELGDPRNQDPEEHLHILTSDVTIPSYWRNGMLGYLSNVQYLRLIIGAENVEDAGEYIVNHPGLTPETDDDIISVNFNSLENCYQYIKQSAQEYIQNNQVVWIQKEELKEYELGWQARLLPIRLTTISYDVDSCCSDLTYHVFNRSLGFNEKVLGCDVEQAVVDATYSEKIALMSQFQIRKRLKPLGDNVWGNWWETVQFDPQAI